MKLLRTLRRWFVLASALAVGSSAAENDANAFEAVLRFAGERNSSAVVIARSDTILAERRWDRPGSRAGITATGWPVEDVASVQKSITAVLVGCAVERGLLRLDEPVTRWLGPGWSRVPADAEAAITVHHLLAMTSGLTERLTLEALAGTRWRYNTPAYCQLLPVLTAAARLELDELTRRWLTGPLGMADSRWQRRSGAAAELNPWGFLTTGHDLVRFGRMILRGGGPVLEDAGFVAAMLRPSQALNPDYGLLWWLNSQPKPGRAGRRIPQAPAEMVAAEGARDCKLFLIPSQDLIVVRLGEAAGRGFTERFWELLTAERIQP